MRNTPLKSDKSSEQISADILILEFDLIKHKNDPDAVKCINEQLHHLELDEQEALE